MKPLRGRRKKEKRSGRAVGATEILSCRPWQSHTIQEFWSSLTTRKLQQPTLFHLMDVSLSFQRKLLTPQLLIYFHSGNNLCKTAARRDPTPLHPSPLFSSSLCANWNYTYHKKRHHASRKTSGNHCIYRNKRPSGFSFLYTCLDKTRKSRWLPCPVFSLLGENSPDALCPGWASQTRADTCKAPPLAGQWTTRWPAQ